MGWGRCFRARFFVFFFFFCDASLSFSSFYFTKHTAAFTLILAIFFFGQKRILDFFFFLFCFFFCLIPTPRILINKMIAPLVIASEIWATFKGKRSIFFSFQSNPCLRSDTGENFQDFSWVCVKIIPFWLRLLICTY